ncbi:MAG: peptide-methionine (S)-S-oxide reductase MsrA [bacterium]|nr:peptide-methionine (S)-S-oxide reductase MsrA [bacterium]
MSESLETATLGAGCFWCIEAVYQQLKGVHSVVSGYMGGEVENPTYQQVCRGNSGHAEVAQITFAPDVISYADILDVFWVTHDPTTLNRQGADVGTQYRSSIFYHSDEQRETAEKSKQQADASDSWPDTIVTEIVAATIFYQAEDDHQNFYQKNSTQPYCYVIIEPKLQKLRNAFLDKLK